MDDELAQIAINCALQSNWHDAIKNNLLILKENKDDVDALNRLSRAYFENGDIAKAKKTSNNVLKIDSTNSIAIKALDKYKHCSPIKSIKDQISSNITSFIEEPGKTKITTLINLGSENTYSRLSAGDEVLLTPYTHKVSVTTMSGAYIGKLTDDLSARLRRFIKGGNKYIILVKSVNKNAFKVFIKEIKKGKDLKNTDSFPREALESFGEFSS